MTTMNDYQRILSEICPIPNFLVKYLGLTSMQRLKEISFFCGMPYASKNQYRFYMDISRYDHSLGVALITWRLTGDKAQTLAALFHDISTPVFSHVIDYMNGDYIAQESTEDKTMEVLLHTPNLYKYLKQDGLTFDDISDFKKYSVVDLDRPALCADRLEGIISGGMGWSGKTDYDLACRILDSMFLYTNENGVEEIGLTDMDVAKKVLEVSDHINELTHRKEDTYMMELLADIVRLMLRENIIIYDDLFTLTEPKMIQLIEENTKYFPDLKDYYEIFTTVENPIITSTIKIKNKILNPLVNGKRMIKMG